MKLLLGVTSAAVYAGTRIVAGAVGGAVLGVLLHRRTQQRLPHRTDWLASSPFTGPVVGINREVGRRYYYDARGNVVAR